MQYTKPDPVHVFNEGSIRGKVTILMIAHKLPASMKTVETFNLDKEASK